MTDQQVREHIRLLEAIQGEMRGVQQLLQRLNDIANTNLNENGQSKQLLEGILNALEK